MTWRDLLIFKISKMAIILVWRTFLSGYQCDLIRFNSISFWMIFLSKKREQWFPFLPKVSSWLFEQLLINGWAWCTWFADRYQRPLQSRILSSFYLCNSYIPVSFHHSTSLFVCFIHWKRRACNFSFESDVWI